MPDAMSPEIQAALDRCRSMITVGSKSFSLASRLFSPATKHAAFFLYGWCRYCDDQTDERRSADSQERRENRLRELIDSTRSALAGKSQEDPVFVALRYVTERYAIPEHYPLELLEGMGMDVRGERYETLDDLLLYCYRVAGTVGLMMVHVMGVSHERALKNAAHLGIAMQLTNIARDIIEDASNGRIYLPLSWLREAGLSAHEIASPANRPKLAALAARLLSEAQRYYRSGDEGIRFLNFRSACAVAAARHVYSDIGTIVEQRGARAWDERAFTPSGRKCRAVARGVLQALRPISDRVTKRWSSVPINTVWPYSAVG